MKADKALRKLERIEALMKVVAERYETSEEHVHEAFRTAKDSIIRARIAVEAKPTTVQAPARELAIVKKAAVKRPVAKAAAKTSLAKTAEKPARKKAGKAARPASGK